MPFKKVNPKEEIDKAIKNNPELEKEIKKADKEYEDVKAGKTNKKFGD